MKECNCKEYNCKLDECNGEHNFQPRYQEYEEIPEYAVKEAGRWNSSEDARYFLEGVQKTKAKKYLFDICGKCGKKVYDRNNYNA